jgi:hypothetical protein
MELNEFSDKDLQVHMINLHTFSSYCHKQQNKKIKSGVGTFLILKAGTACSF